MKAQMDRKYPILVDVGEQAQKKPSSEYVFMYDDGAVYRAFSCQTIDVGTSIVSALDNDGIIVCSIPSDTPWRYIHKDNLEFVTGAEMEEVELRNFKTKRDLQKSLMKELGLDKKGVEGEQELKTEYSDTGFNPRLYH